MKNKLKFICFVIVMASSFNACKSNTSTKDITAEMAKKGMIPVDANIFKTDNGWGYSIVVDNKLFIRQSIVPAVPGNKGFATEEDASKVAELVINKLKKQQRPTIKKEELQQLGIIQ